MTYFIDLLNQYHLSIISFSLAFLAALILGLGKAGVKGLGVIIVTIMALVFGGKASTGILIPLMVVADIFAVIYYHKHTQWNFLLKLLPTMVLGVLLGITSMIGNLAGSFANIYFLAMRLPKNEFIGTAAWLFLIINVFKLPFHIFVWKTVTLRTIFINIFLIPAIFIGFFTGVTIVKLINNDIYRKFILIATVIGALLILIK